MFIQKFWLCFVPLFIAVDALGILPIFISLTYGTTGNQRSRIIFVSILTAMIVGLTFLFVGKAVFRLLGITVADFMIAGGIVLFLIALGELLRNEPASQPDIESLGSVPLGVPLIAGPAVLTTIMLLAGEYGVVPTALAVIANIIIAGMIFHLAGLILSIIGSSGSKIISKIANLFLSAIAVVMVRKGLGIILADF
ncbi:MAG: MarC family protein [Fibrobacter sp.]|nr:MarC family protein [Fibrobacter sp.]